MINVVIYGVNIYTIKIINLIDENKCNITAIVTNKKKNMGKNLRDIPIVALEDINKQPCELIITTVNDKIDNDILTINFKEYFKSYYDFEISSFLYKLSTNDRMLDGFITGLSCAKVGIDEDIVCGNVINAAASSQDIFYDFEIAKYILCRNKFANSIKFALIALTYFSFEFDLSKSGIKDRVYYYYPFIRSLHNKDDLLKKKCEKFNQLEIILEKIFIKDYKNEIYKDLKSEYEDGWKEFTNGYITKEKMQIGIEDAKKDSLKDYPKTVEENIKILNRYIEFLKERNITPYIIIVPMSKYYSSYLSERIKSEFKTIIEEVSKKKDVKVYDYFNSSIFSDNDFYDAAHLNRSGARKFTELINSQILSEVSRKIN
jgi:hypothetical protein